jgi:hypothetical protein
MSEEIDKTGGPAFPGFSYTEGRGNFKRNIENAEWECHMPGMSLRDFMAAKFAAKLCAGEEARMLADKDGRYDGESNWAEVVAMNAYEFADAMLKERNKTK